MQSSGILRRVALVRTDISFELSAYTIMGIRIGELGTTLAVTSYRRTQRWVLLLLLLLLLLLQADFTRWLLSYNKIQYTNKISHKERATLKEKTQYK
jgi:sulfite exporter TauE/SafE